jgi:hypothetical protein
VNLAIWREVGGTLHGAVNLEPHEARAVAYALLNAADAARYQEGNQEGVTQ